jgi:hypothetical protein
MKSVVLDDLSNHGILAWKEKLSTRYSEKTINLLGFLSSGYKNDLVFPVLLVNKNPWFVCIEFQLSRKFDHKNEFC